MLWTAIIIDKIDLFISFLHVRVFGFVECTQSNSPVISAHALHKCGQTDLQPQAKPSFLITHASFSIKEEGHNIFGLILPDARSKDDLSKCRIFFLVRLLCQIIVSDYDLSFDLSNI